MPCVTDPPSGAETKRRRLNDLLDEIGDRTPSSDYFFLGRSRPLTLDEMTQRLCAWAKEHDAATMSLEFQIWWRDHQAWDAKREASERAKADRSALRASALAKLTPEERDALR